MNYKIVETPAKYPDVLIYWDISDESEAFVRIFATGTINGDSDMIAEEEVGVESIATAKNIVRDFSENSAIDWCEKNEITY